ncbi:hypothetical protein GGI03_001803, partial [Coemansia sp. RSA 2337]
MYVPPITGTATMDNKKIRVAMHHWICDKLVEADNRDEAILLIGDLNPIAVNPPPAERAMNHRLDNPLTFKEAWWNCNGRTNDSTHTRKTRAGTSRHKLDFIYASGWLENIIQYSKSTNQTLL